MDTLHPGARRIVERVEEELDQTCSENLRGRSSCLPEVHGADADHSVHRNQEIIRKILTHLELYLVRSRPPPRAPPKDFWFDSPYSQVPDADDYLHTDPEYTVDDYLC